MLLAELQSIDEVVKQQAARASAQPLAREAFYRVRMHLAGRMASVKKGIVA